MGNILLAFFGKFFFVYLLGIQTINVVRGKYVVAFFVSIIIGVAEIFVIVAVIEATNTNNWLVYAAAILGGALGIALATLQGRKK